ncbi:glycine-rich domain-containing protein, partial [Flavobacterium denitrificans]|uniref:glycine-rich domain-containing protein n=1 Tax=Flavobacterium denitrificans TaxID=281361 RepID=UPI0031588C3C
MIRKLLLFVRSLFLNFSNSSKERSFLSSNRMLCLGMFFVVPFFTFGQSPATFNSSGTFTVPAGVTSITVECWGGGGAGGMNNETYKNGGGGGGGGYSKTTNITVTPLQSYSITVGTGGVPSASNGDGKPTSATFGVITVSALGGKGGTSAQPGIGGNGAALGTGAITYAGGNGSNGDNGEFGGGGGSSAGTGASGTTVGIPNPIGTGAIAPAGGGNGGNGFIGNSNSGGNGQPGSIPGGGGGGGRNGQIVFGTNRSGGAGANGQVIITYCNTTAPTGTVSQSFCSGASPTVANLAATGTAIKWYSASSGGSP